MGQVLKEVSKISGLYGQPGEQKVSRYLAENLPDDYVILNSPRLYFHGATFDIDHIVIGPNGFFVIETKNMQGKILGGMMGNWIQERKRTGKNRLVKIGNPANQVHQYGKVTRSYTASRYAYDTGLKPRIKVYPIVVFVNDEINLSEMEYTRPGMVGRVRVLKLSELADYITSREGVSYSAAEIQQFAELLVPLTQRDQTQYFSADMMEELSGGFTDRYEIYEELGRGSFGVVYAGYDHKLDDEVAIKKLPAGRQNDPNAVKRFYREAQIASSLVHENIVGVYDFFEDSGDHYIVMELVDGQTLEEYIRENPVTVDEALRITKEVCKAVVYAHRNGVIHRDLKPSNIMITKDGAVKVSDFGIAKLLHDTNDLTVAGDRAGTPVIMSPEQIAGQAVSEKSDVFAIGVLLYYLVTGKMPFDGDHLGEIVHKITRYEPVLPRRLNNRISPDAEAVIMKALEKNPQDRFDNAEDLLQAVEQLIKTGKVDMSIGQKRWLHLVPAFLRPIIRSERRLFALITVTSLIIFVGLLGFQAYRDSRQLSREALLTKQYGFTNENLKSLFENPKLYMGLPVNVVGRVEKIIKTDKTGTWFNMVVNSIEGRDNLKIIVVYNNPDSSFELTSYIKISGSLQNVVETPDNFITPVVIADKVENLADPWSILAPSQFTVFSGAKIKQYNTEVQLEKIEFAEKETRVFIRMQNTGTSDETLLLANPMGRQGSRIYRELTDSYRTMMPAMIRLQPGQVARQVIFLEPMDRRLRSATVILGSSNDLLMGQKPYEFHINWQ